MSRLHTMFAVVLPSMIAGGLLFNAARSQAASTDAEGFWPAPVVIAQADPPKRPPPAPPAPPAPKPPKAPPAPPAPPAGGVSVTINNGVVKVTGVQELVKAQLGAARVAITSNPRIPADVRAKILARIDKVGAAVDKRLANIKLTDLDKLDEEMEKMGEELEEALEGLDEDLDKLGDHIGKDIKVDLGKLHFGHDDDDDIDIPSPPDDDADDDDMREAISDLKDLALTSQQRDQITKLRADSDKQVAAAKKQIAELSGKLHTALGQPGVTDADITRLVDQISGQEATMRKARIVAWAQARRMLDAAQRKKIEDAAAKAKKTK